MPGRVGEREVVVSAKRDVERSEVKLRVFVDQVFGENAYVVYRLAPGSCWVIDPSFPPQVEQILGFIDEHDLTVAAIVLTHGHGDHIAGVDAVHDRWPEARVLIAREDAHMLGDASANMSAPFGAPFTVSAEPDGDLVPGHELLLDDAAWRVLDTSGHTPGGRSLYCPAAKLVITGDALFAGTIGRVDLPHSDGRRLIANLRENLLSLPDDTVVYPGHGDPTDIGTERRGNPFLVSAAGRRPI